MPVQSGTKLPFDYEVEQGQLKRRQGVIDALTQRFLTPAQPGTMSNAAGTFSTGPNALTAALTPILGMMATEHSQQNLNADQTGLAQRYKEGLQGELEKYEGTRGGQGPGMVPSMAPTIDNDPQNPKMVPDPQNPGVAPNPRKAAIEAIVSSYAPLQQIGMSDLKEAGKGQITAKDLLPYTNPNAIPALMTKGLPGFRGKSELGEVNGIVYDKNDRSVVTLGGPKPELVTQNNDLYEKSPSTGAMRKLDNAPKTNVSVGGPKAGADAYFKHAAAQVHALGETASASQKLLSTLDSLKQLHNAGIYSNLPSGGAVALNNIAQALGAKVDTTKLGNTETYNSLITDLWQRAVAQYGGNRGVTQGEAEEIKKLTPLASSSPQAREQLFAIQSAVAQRNIKAYQQANTSFARAAFAEDPRLFTIPGDIEASYIPGANNESNPSVTPPAKKPSVSGW